MERLYQQYRDLVEFRLVYIREAHAADTNFSEGLAVELGLKEHQSHADRCHAAEMLLHDKLLTIPCLIDDMHDAVSKAYRAHPDRVFLVRPDGRLAVAAEGGPGGFAPALEKVDYWLKEFEELGRPPGLSPRAEEPGGEQHIATVLPVSGQ